MIIDNCADLQKKITEYKNLVKIEIDADSLIKCRDELSQRKELLDSIKDQKKVLETKQIVDKKNLPTPEKQLQKLKSVKDKFNDDFTKIKEGRNFKFLLDSLDEFHSSILSILKNKWEQHVDEQPIIADNQLELFQNTHKNIIAQIKYLKQSIPTYRQNPPKQLKGYDDFINLVKSIQELAQKIPYKDLPKDVQIFLDELNSASGASLGSLTETVKNWLEEKDLLDSYSIKPKPPRYI